MEGLLFWRQSKDSGDSVGCGEICCWVSLFKLRGYKDWWSLIILTYVSNSHLKKKFIPLFHWDAGYIKGCGLFHMLDEVEEVGGVVRWAARVR